MNDILTDNTKKYIRIQYIYIIIAIVITFILWFTFIHTVDPFNTSQCNVGKCKTEPCVGFNCKTGTCHGPGCRSGDCIGENCKAGNCYGLNCKAGDCYGYGCSPGICYDTLCSKNCPPNMKKCSDGVAKQLERPFYYNLTQYFPTRSVFNPPICNPDITSSDIKNRMPNFDLNTVYWYYNGPKKPDQKIVDDVQIDKIIGTDPSVYKNDNCTYCIKNTSNNTSFCPSYSPSYDYFNQRWVWI